jgi:outer membrane protein TolC
MAKTAKGKSQPDSTTTETNETGETLAVQPTEEEIAHRAYHIYLERGAAEGDSQDDWLQAERELTEAKS